MRISVYITSYNQKSYLEEAIESVLGQTRRPDQLIIIDDASTDGSQEVIKGYVETYSDLILPIYHVRNAGIARTRVEALQAVVGDFVTYLDGDDRMLPKKLELEARQITEQKNISLVYSNHYYIDQYGERTGIWAESYPFPREGIFKDTFTRNFPGRNIFRMELINYPALKEIGFHDPELNLYEDYDLRIRMTKKLDAGFVDHPLFEIRRTGQGLSSQSIDHHLLALEYILEKNLHLLASFPARERNKMIKEYRRFMARIAARGVRFDYSQRQNQDSASPAHYMRKIISYSPFFLLDPGVLKRILIPPHGTKS